ncbi:unnamed protein product [Nezara viridula]|uniref:Uncharacterized protein n=1 Tax=Nezara viridula TaxID=85310 RepID=A0A9P0ECN3_NEZVI|nr:unnamed protein product [Nezara viridula]
MSPRKRHPGHHHLPNFRSQTFCPYVRLAEHRSRPYPITPSNAVAT